MWSCCAFSITPIALLSSSRCSSFLRSSSLSQLGFAAAVSISSSLASVLFSTLVVGFIGRLLFPGQAIRLCSKPPYPIDPQPPRPSAVTVGAGQSRQLTTPGSSPINAVSGSGFARPFTKRRSEQSAACSASLSGPWRARATALVHDLLPELRDPEPDAFARPGRGNRRRTPPHHCGPRERSCGVFESRVRPPPAPPPRRALSSLPCRPSAAAAKEAAPALNRSALSASPLPRIDNLIVPPHASPLAFRRALGILADGIRRRKVRCEKMAMVAACFTPGHVLIA